MSQTEMFSKENETPDFNKATFDGADYIEKFDQKRLATQLGKVYTFMKNGHWRTLDQIEMAINAPQASISACLRDLRKERNGSHTVDKRRKGDPKKGWYEYKLILNNGSDKGQ